MRHSKVENWSPHVLAQSGLFDGMHDWPAAMLDAPVVNLQPHEPLARSRSGHALAMFVIAGEVRQRTGDATRSYGSGALVGVRELASAAVDVADVVAVSDSVVMLLDRHRIHALCKVSPAFAVHIASALLQLDADASAKPPDITEMPNPIVDAVVPAGLRNVVVVRLVNREALELCHGTEIGRNAIRAIARAVDLSIRPNDVRTFLGENEFLIAIEGDRLAASIIATRLVSRCSRIVAMPDMRTPLPHLHLVIGLGEVQPGDTMASVAYRARAAASNAIEIGETFAC